MLFEGFKLMFVGMTTVLLFLIFTILVIQVVSRLARGAGEREVEALRLEREHRGLARLKTAKVSSKPATDFEDDLAVIAAAVAAYEAEAFAGS